MILLQGTWKHVLNIIEALIVHEGLMLTMKFKK